jgi:hypothetical protein
MNAELGWMAGGQIEAPAQPPAPEPQRTLYVSDALAIHNAQARKWDADFERIWGAGAREQGAARQQQAIEAGIEAQVAAGVPEALHTRVAEARRAADEAHQQVRAAEQRVTAHVSAPYVAADVPARSAKRAQLQAELTDYQQLAAQADVALGRAKEAVQQARHAAWQRLGHAAQQAHAQAASHASAEQEAANRERDQRIATATDAAWKAWETLQRLEAFRP